MFKIDGPGGVAGTFVDEDISTGQEPTAVTSEWLNSVQSELVALVEMFGGTLSKSDSQQAAKAHIDAIRMMRHSYYSTVGTSTSYVVLIPSDHFVISSISDLHLRLRFHESSDANPTLYVVGSLAKNLKQFDATGTKVDAVVKAGQVSDVYFDGTDFVLLDPLLPDPFFAGMTLRWPSPTPPPGWLWCNGAAVSRTAYSKLFSMIGTAYGIGDGSTTFNLPDSRDRMPMGAGNLYYLGDQGGSRDATLVSHSHSVSDPGHVHYGSYYFSGGSGFPQMAATNTPGGTLSASVTNAKTNISISNEGAASANANLPPYLSDYVIIKY